MKRLLLRSGETVLMGGFCSLVAISNCLHPLVHAFENGTLDDLLTQANIVAIGWLTRRNT